MIIGLLCDQHFYTRKLAPTKGIKVYYNRVWIRDETVLTFVVLKCCQESGRPPPEKKKKRNAETRR